MAAASTKAKEQQKKQADRHRRQPDTYKAGDQAYVHNDVFALNRTGDVGEHAALAKPWRGPFEVLEAMENDNYRVQIHMPRKHNVFYVDKLKRYVKSPLSCEGKSQLPPPTMQRDDDLNDYEVHEIVDRRMVKGERLYKVVWKGYAWDEGTWEPVEHLVDAQETVDAFDATFGGVNEDATVARTKRKGEKLPDPDSKRSKVKEDKRLRDDYAMRVRSMWLDDAQASMVS